MTRGYLLLYDFVNVYTCLNTGTFFLFLYFATYRNAIGIEPATSAPTARSTTPCASELHNGGSRHHPPQAQTRARNTITECRKKGTQITKLFVTNDIVKRRKTFEIMKHRSFFLWNHRHLNQEAHSTSAYENDELYDKETSLIPGPTARISVKCVDNRMQKKYTKKQRFHLHRNESALNETPRRNYKNWKMKGASKMLIQETVNFFSWVAPFAEQEWERRSGREMIFIKKPRGNITKCTPIFSPKSLDRSRVPVCHRTTSPETMASRH